MSARCGSLLALLFLASMSILGAFTTVPVRGASYLPHSWITINGNAAFTKTNGVTGGSGTPSDPYIIQGWDINASGLPCCNAWGNAGLMVENTNASFIIRDVYVHSGKPLGFGIILHQVSNGQVENSVTSDNDVGISVDLSTNVTVMGNTVFSDNWYGIYLWHTNESSVAFNNVYSNKNAGLFLYTSYHVTVASNYVHDQTFFGIDTYTTDYDTFVANNVSNNGQMGLRLLYSDYNLVYHNNFVSNGQNPPPYNMGFQVNDDPPTNHASPNPPQNTTNRWDDGYPIGGNYFSDGIHQDYCSGRSQNICNYPDWINDGSEGINSEYVYNNGASSVFYVITQDYYPLAAPFHATTSLPGFAVTTPPSTTLSQGSSVSIIVTITSLGNYSDNVNINATTNAEDTTITPSITNINVQPGSQATSTFRLTAGNAAPIGKYALSIHGSGSGLTHNLAATFSISPATQQPPSKPPAQPPASPPNSNTPSTPITLATIVTLAPLIAIPIGAALALVLVTRTKPRKNPDPTTA